MKEGRSRQRKGLRKHHKPTHPQTEKDDGGGGGGGEQYTAPANLNLRESSKSFSFLKEEEEVRSRKRKRVRKLLLHHKSPHPHPLKQTTIGGTNGNAALVNANVNVNADAAEQSTASSANLANSSKNSSFLDKMRAKLSGGHFRMINEKLYTCSGDEALNYFEEAPSLFDVTPLNSLSVDVVVFCLSLMGTNFPSYLKEAHRVLKPCGWLLIAEVKSRFDPNTGGADPDRFSKAICELGFTSLSKDFSNKMFILLYFKKKEKQSSKKEIEWPKLKPCLYKRR